MILKMIGQCGVICIMMLLVKTITSVLNVLTYIITSITACPFELDVILVIMSVLTFVIDVILYVMPVYNIQDRIEQSLIKFKCQLKFNGHLHLLEMYMKLIYT
jgi:hypothetical protein